MPGFTKGELIISSKPYAYVLEERCRGKFCDYCFRENAELKKCGRCGFPYYCDKNCQKEAREMHKTECKFLRGRVLPDSNIRLLILVLMKIKKYGYEVPFEEVGNWKATISSLMSHAEDFKKERLDSVIQFKILTEYYIGSENVPPFDEFVEIYGKIATNAFSIYSIISGVSGTGLYLGPSFFDHSCDDDAAWTYDGTTLNIRMMRDVSHRDMSQVRISYCKIISLNEERINHLLETKFFVCSCSICTSPKSDELLIKLVSDEPEVKEKAMKCKEEVEELLSNGPSLEEPQLLYDECKRLLLSQSAVLADTNVYRIRTLEQAFEACLKLEKDDDAVELASHLEKPYRMYYGPNHPKLGIFLFEYGVNLFLTGHVSESLSKLSEAETKLKVTLGENHPVILLLNIMIREA